MTPNKHYVTLRGKASVACVPVHKIQVNIVDPKVLQRSIKRGPDILRRMRVVPELRRDEELFPRNLGLADGLADS